MRYRNGKQASVIAAEGEDSSIRQMSYSIKTISCLRTS